MLSKIVNGPVTRGEPHQVKTEPPPSDHFRKKMKIVVHDPGSVAGSLVAWIGGIFSGAETRSSNACVGSILIMKRRQNQEILP